MTSGVVTIVASEEECVRTLVESNQRLNICVCWFSAKHTCLIKAIGDSQDIVSTCSFICNRTEFVLYFILFYWASLADVGYQVYSLCLTCSQILLN